MRASEFSIDATEINVDDNHLIDVWRSLDNENRIVTDTISYFNGETSNGEYIQTNQECEYEEQSRVTYVFKIPSNLSVESVGTQRLIDVSDDMWDEYSTEPDFKVHLTGSGALNAELQMNYGHYGSPTDNVYAIGAQSSALEIDIPVSLKLTNKSYSGSSLDTSWSGFQAYASSSLVINNSVSITAEIQKTDEDTVKFVGFHANGYRDSASLDYDQNGRVSSIFLSKEVVATLSGSEIVTDKGRAELFGMQASLGNVIKTPLSIKNEGRTLIKNNAVRSESGLAVLTGVTASENAKIELNQVDIVGNYASSSNGETRLIGLHAGTNGSVQIKGDYEFIANSSSGERLGLYANGGTVILESGIHKIEGDIRVETGNLYKTKWSSTEYYFHDLNLLPYPSYVKDEDVTLVEQKNGYIDLYLTSEESYLSGLTFEVDSDSSENRISLNLSEGASWYVPSDNLLKGALTISNAHLWLGFSNETLYEDVASGPQLNRSQEFVRLDAESVSIDDSTLHLTIDIAAETAPATEISLDQFSFQFAGTEEGMSENNVLTALINLEGTANVQNYTNHWFIEQVGDGKLEVLGHEGRNVYVDGSPTSWQIAYFAGDEAPSADDDFSKFGSTSHGEGHWYLIRSEHTGGGETSDPDDPSTPPEVTDNVTIGISASQALAYMADLEDLRKRLGEVRYGAQAGVWTKVFAKKDSVDVSGNRGFEQDVYGINIGFDTLVSTSELSSWLVGGAFRYSNADQEGVGIGGTTGKLNEYSVKGYATWMHERGSYADFVLQVGRYEQELDGLSNTREKRSHADYGTWGFGASIEIGHMFSFAEKENDRHWFNNNFIEPQLELSYFHARGADYSTSTGLKVSQDNADFLTGRAGVVLGTKFSYGTEDELDRRYFQFAVIGGIKHEFLGGDQTISYIGVDGARAYVRADDIDGTRFYYGLNADWQIADDFRLYAQIAREEGSHYTKDYDVSVGAKWSF